MTHPSFPAKSLADVIALAKKEPGKVTVGTPPPPTINYFAAELFKSLTGAEVTIVSYKGTGPLTNDLVGGHVAVGLNTIPPAIGNIEAGQLRAIAVAAPARSAALPDVPTAEESGVPGFDAVQYYGLSAPAGIPRPIIDRLNKELRLMIKSEEMSKVGCGGIGRLPSGWRGRGGHVRCLLIEVNRPSVLPRVNSRKWTHNRLREGLHSWPLKSSGAMDLA